MNYIKAQKMQNAKNYLFRFDEILNQMEDKMLSFEPTTNITLYFIECMIPHHQAAIYMCENLLKYTNYKPLQDIAHNIIKTQTNGIEQMQEIARTTSGFYNTKEDINRYLEKYLSITKNMIHKMRIAPRCININLNFVNEMIPHHEGAIEMCNNLLQYYTSPRLRLVAESIIKEQSNGVKQLKEIQKQLCAYK